jgi:hypothetical protein
MELDFDSWEDYKPVGDGNIEVNEVENPNVLKLKVDDDVTLLEVDKDDFNEIFNHYSEEDYNGNIFLRFRKSHDFEFENEKITLFDCVNDEDSFVLKKNNKLYYLNVYQSGDYYQDENKLTFTGWDYNIIINLNKMTAKTQNVR